MLVITELRKKVAHRNALITIEAMGSDRQVEEKMMELERSTSNKDRLQAIAMRSILNGNTEESFKKACKVYTKTTKEHLRLA